MTTRILLIVLLSFKLQAGLSQEWLWNKQFGAGYNDVGSHIQCDNDGNLIIAGTYQLEVDLGDITLPFNGYNEIFLIKYTPTGEIIWAKHFGTNEFENYPIEEVSHLAVDIQNNIYMTVNNETSDQIYDCSEYPIIGYGGTLVKLNPDGECLWWKQVGKNDYWQGYFNWYYPIPGPDNSLFISGGSDTTYDLDGCFLEMTEGDSYHGFIAKRDGEGDCEWQIIAESDSITSLKAQCIEDNFLYFTGSLRDDLSLGGYTLENDGSNYLIDPLIGKMDLEGNVLWLKSLEIDPTCFSGNKRNMIATNGIMGIQIWRYTEEFEVSGETVEIINPEQKNYAFVKFSLETGDLDFLFSISTGYSGGGDAPWIIAHNDSFFVFTGQFANSTIPCFGYNVGDSFGMSIVQLNQNGECNSYMFYPGNDNGSFHIYDADLSTDGTIYATGVFSDYPTLATQIFSAGMADVFVAAMNYPISVNELSQATMELKLVNPANMILEGWIETNAGSEHYQLMIYDLSGKVVTNTVVKSEKFTLDIAGLANGYYTVQVKSDGSVTHGEFVKQ